MNIFVLDFNPKIAAKYHCDEHVKKMPIETCQMLVAGIYYLNGFSYRKERINPHNKEKIQSIFIDYPLTENTIEKYGDGAPGLSFTNHPCSIWARESLENFKWLIELGKQLCIQYIDVFKTSIICDSQLCWIEDWLEDNHQLFNMKKVTPFVQAMPEQYKNENTVVAYRNYYTGEKRFATWRNRTKPEWFQ
jgi:hypothetical protein